MRVQAAGQNRLGAAGHPVRHGDGLRAGCGAVIHRGVGDLHAGQVRHLGLELEQHLERPLRDFRLVGRVGGEPFAALDQMIDSRRDMMAIGAGTDEERPVAGGEVLFRQGSHVGFDGELGRVARQVDGPIEQRAARHSPEQGLGGGYTDHRQHVGTLGIGMGKVSHGELVQRFILVAYPRPPFTHRPAGRCRMKSPHRSYFRTLPSRP